MGIPRFYRYMSERYPLINQPISDVSLLPEFDCFYLDMNGIIHNCTHSDAHDSELNTLALPAQLHAIFTVLDRLITHIIKPKQLVYIAIDGVAPRAKLNQQRSRRFRAGLDRQLALEEDRHRQITLDDGAPPKDPAARFDSNCITPGTSFLSQLSQHLVWFVRHKMKTDPLWARLEVFFSGSEVPGEGEHKIADFIRHRKMAPGYPANVRHCMYGSDADLMLLGLMTHEPHFTLVREVVVWGAQRGPKISAKKIDEEQWQLVHLSLFREYLMMEMRVVAELDGDRMLDDFVLLTYLLGNDFIPHSPTLEISEDAIPLLLQVYRQHLDKHGGQYLTDSGKLINIALLQDLLVTIGGMEEEILINRAIEEAKKQRKRGFRDRPKTPQVEVDEDEVAMALELLNMDEDADGADILPPLIDEDEEERQEKELLEALEGEEQLKQARSQDQVEHEIIELLTGSESFQDTKWTYYERKFGIKRGNCSARNSGLEQIKLHYLEAIVWCLEYYYQGPPSWSWYYPYHYSPMVSDLTDIADTLASISFGSSPEDGPLLPFEQLMSNLPSSSAHLVPEPYRFLMMSPLSPIKHFYPETFEIDMEGKKNSWEGINLLPFIDVALLKAAIAQYCPDHLLTQAERDRNHLQTLPLRISYDPHVYSTVPSTMPGFPGFSDIISCCTRVENYALPPITSHGGRYQSRLMDGVILPMAGFPSLYTLPLESVRVENVRLNCFGMGSRKSTLILQLPPTGPLEDAVDPNALVGSTALVNWPNLHEALVVGLSTLSGEYRLDDSPGRDGKREVRYAPFEPNKKTEWAQYVQSEVNRLLCGRGTPGSGGVDVGRMGISCLLHVLPLQGMISDPVTGAINKQFGQTEAVIPLQLCVVNRTLYDARFEETGPMPLNERFPVDSVGLVTNGNWLGCTAVVKATNAESNTVTVHVNTIDKEPPFGYVIAQQIVDRYFPGFMVAQRLGISTTTLGVLTGSVAVKPGDHDIGLNLRFRKDLVLPGYCRLVQKGNTERAKTSVDEESNVWRRGDIVKIVGSGVSLEPHASGPKRSSTPPGGGGGNGMVWEYSERTLAVLSDYKTRFPLVFQQLEQLPFAGSYQGKDLFKMSDRKKIDAEIEAIEAWIDHQGLGKKEHAKHIPTTSLYISLAAMRAVEAAGTLRARERTKDADRCAANPVVVELPAGDLFRPNPLVNQDLTGSAVAAQVTKNPGAPFLGDRVVNISARGVPFGQRGTIVATHVSSKCVEVLFDEGFTGGEPLYGSSSLDRGKLVPWNQVICVSNPPGMTAERRRNERVATRSRAGPNTAQQQRPAHAQSAKGSSAPLQVSTNYRKPRAQPVEVVSAVPTSTPPAPSIAPEVVAAAPSAMPAPPDPAKMQKLMRKWSSRGSSVDSTDEPAPAPAPVIPAAVETAPAQPDEAIAPSVAALFSAAESAATSNASSVPDALAALFPHLAHGNPMAPAFQPPLPPQPPMDGLAYVNPYYPQGAMPPPMPPMPPTTSVPPATYPEATAGPARRRGPRAKPAPAPAPVESMTEYPPLGSVPDVTAPVPVPAAVTTRTSATTTTKTSKKWAPKTAAATATATATASTKKTPNLLLPVQVMRQQQKPAQ